MSVTMVFEETEDREPGAGLFIQPSEVLRRNAKAPHKYFVKS